MPWTRKDFKTVQFSQDRSHEIVSVGVLNPSQFKEHPGPTKLDHAGTREAAMAWEAVTAAEPDALVAFLAAREHSLPFLQRGLFALLYRYPELSTGLNAWEYQLLRYVREEGPNASTPDALEHWEEIIAPLKVFGEGYLLHCQRAENSRHR